MIRRIRWSNDGTEVYSLCQHQWSNLGYWPGRRIMFSNQTNKDTLDSDIASNSYLFQDVMQAGIQAGTMIFNFPKSLTVTAVGLRSSAIWYAFRVMSSTNSIDGYDGSWVNLYGPGDRAANVYNLINVTPTACKWLKLGRFDSYYQGINNYALHIYGEYASERFELWDVNEVVQLPDYGNFDLPNASTYSNYTNSTPFKIKNTDSVAHTYNVTLSPTYIGGDTFVTNHMSVSKDGGDNKSLTLVTASVNPSQFSEQIDVFGDVPQLDNPTDGVHYYKVTITQN